MRIENWDVALVAFAEYVRGRPFIWGETDCATLVRRGLGIMLDGDPWRGHLGTWKTKIGAFRISSKTDARRILRGSGAVRVVPGYETAGDLALGPGRDAHGLLRVSLLIPSRKALVAFPDQGVRLVDTLSLIPGTSFWRYE